MAGKRRVAGLVSLSGFRQSHVIITVTRTAAAHGSPKNDIAGRFSMQRWRTPRCVTFIAFSIASARLCLPKIVNRAKVHQRASCAGHLADGVRRPSAGSSTLRHCNRRTVRSRSPRIVKHRRRGGRRGLKLAWQVSTGGTCSSCPQPGSAVIGSARQALINDPEERARARQEPTGRNAFIWMSPRQFSLGGTGWRPWLPPSGGGARYVCAGEACDCYAACCTISASFLRA